MQEFNVDKFRIREVTISDAREWMCPFCNSLAQTRQGKHSDCGAHLFRVANMKLAYQGDHGRMADTMTQQDMVAEYKARQAAEEKAKA